MKHAEVVHERGVVQRGAEGEGQFARHAHEGFV